MRTNVKLKQLFFCVCITPLFLTAQEIAQLPWEQRDRQEMKPLDYQYQREVDVMWSKNVWRIIDVRQKPNLPFKYPQAPLIQVIHEAVKRGELQAYNASGLNADQFNQKLTAGEAAKIGYMLDTIYAMNPITQEEELLPMANELSWDKIVKYKVKEVWFFDTRTSTMQVRILGIAPIMEDYDAAGNYRGDMTMYWIYFPDLRPLLAKQEVFNPQNDWQHYSWDDLFAMRKFSSYIYKESNVYDRAIQEYASGVDAQLENDRIKQSILEYEHDMWNY
jgi:gliding motility associated protien GldN